jgi:hypothetical protein
MRWLLFFVLLILSICTAATLGDLPTSEEVSTECSSEGDEETCATVPTNDGGSDPPSSLGDNSFSLYTWYSTMVTILGSLTGIIMTASRMGVMSTAFNYFAKLRNIEDMKRKMKNQRLPLLTTVWDVKFRLWGYLSPKDKMYWTRIAESKNAEAMAYHPTHTTFLIGQLFYDLEQLRTDPFFSVHLNLALPLQKVSMMVNSAFSLDNFSIWPFPVGELVSFSLKAPRTWQDIVRRKPSKVVRVKGWVRCLHCFGGKRGH